MTGLWLRQIRSRLETALPVSTNPMVMAGHAMRMSRRLARRARWRFRTLLRNVMHYPANNLPIHSKIATIFNQGWRERAQFDGSVADVNARSSLAAVGRRCDRSQPCAYGDRSQYPRGNRLYDRLETAAF